MTGRSRAQPRTVDARHNAHWTPMTESEFRSRPTVDTTSDYRRRLEMGEDTIAAPPPAPPPADLPPEDPATDFRAVADHLWQLLDDIDTAGDAARGDDAAYRAAVERIQRLRFEVGSTDGYRVAFRSPPPTKDVLP